MILGIIKWDRTTLWIAGTCLLFNAIVLISIVSFRPIYLSDYHLNTNPDAVHFVELARNIYERQAFSRQTEPPYSPCAARQPGYPIVMGLFYEWIGTIGIYVLNVACHTLTALVVYSLGSAILGSSAARLAGFFVAMDFMLAIINFTAMSEPLFVLTATIAVLFWIQSLADSRHKVTGLLVFIGLLLGFSTLVRPTSLYLPIVIFLGGGLVTLVQRNSLPLLRSIFVSVVSIAVVAPWIARNYLVFGLPRVSSTDATNLVYWAGASAHAMHLGIEIEEARDRIVEEFGLVTLVESNNHWIADRPLKQLYDEQRSASNEILFRYPLALIKSSCVGIIKSSISHNVGNLALICGLEWHGPKLAKLTKGDTSGVTSMFESNPLFLILIFLWEMTCSCAAVILATLGVVRGLLNLPTRGNTILICLVVGYYFLTIAVVGSDAYFRHRAMIVPFLALLAAQTIRPLRLSESGNP